MDTTDRIVLSKEEVLTVQLIDAEVRAAQAEVKLVINQMLERKARIIDKWKTDNAIEDLLKYQIDWEKGILIPLNGSE